MSCVDCQTEISPQAKRCLSCRSKNYWDTGALRGRPIKPSQVRTLSPVEAAWVGAMVEGEGCIRILTTSARGHKQGRMDVTNTEVETNATILRLVGDGGVHHDMGAGRNKRVWRWGLASKLSVISLLKQIIPYLTGKREKAQEMVRVLSSPPTG